jgi:MFS family permease
VATLAHPPRSALSLGTVGLAVLCVSQFVDVLSVNTAVIALPDIRADLGMSTAGAQWVISAYALLFGGLLLFGGRLADRVGHRGLFVAGMAAFGGASLVCAVAPSGAVLVASRAATGVAAALTVPAALALLVSGTDTGRRRRALGWWTAAGAGGGVTGLALGGLVTDVAGWRWTFVVPAVLALACLPFARSLRAADRPGADRPLDGAGALVVVAGLVLLLTGLASVGEGGFGPAAWGPLVAAALAFAALARIEARARWPLLPRGLIANRRLVAGTLASAVNTAVTSPLGVLGTIYLQSVLGWTPAANGLAFVPFSLMVIAGSALGALLLGRLGAARALTLAFVPLGVVPLVATSITADGGAAVLIAAWAVDGLALGVAAVTATALGTAAAPSGDRGFAAGLINTATQLGTAASVALLIPLAATVAGDDPSPADTVDGLRVAFLAIAAIALAGGTAALALLRRRGG